MLVFVHINKTAGSTMRHILRSTYGARHSEVEPWHAEWEDPPFSAADLRRVRKIYPRLASIAGHRISGYVDLEEPGTDLTYFSFVRNPLVTMASRFQYHVDYRKKEGLVFEEWVTRDWLRNSQTRRIAGVADAAEAIRVIEQKKMFVGLAERFNESIIMLKTLRANDLDIGYRRVNVARKNTIAKELLSTERTRNLLVDANQQDLELYRYVEKELYPRFQQEYGASLNDAVTRYESKRGGFNKRNVSLYRLKQHGVHGRLLALYRRPGTKPVVERLLS